jgi:hypothetical protein
VGALDTIALLHAAGELVTNVVEHAYAGRVSEEQGSLHVRANLAPDGTIEIEVADGGRWRTPDAEGSRGRGLAMAESLVDELRVERHPSGTRARLRHRVTVAPELLTASAAETSGADERERLEISFGGARVALAGPIDPASAADLRRSLALVTRGGTTPVLVDLAAVSTLSSAGVQVLAEQLARPESPVRLLAPAGSPAQQVLDLARLPYVSS